MRTILRLIGGLIAAGAIWLFQIVLAAGLFVGWLFILKAIALVAGLNIDDKTTGNVGLGLCFALTIASIFWLERKSRRYGLDFLFSWLPV
jgi:hypothetical protein